jgi:hypothetical protein
MDPLTILQLGSMLISSMSNYQNQKANNQQARARMEAAFEAAGYDLSMLESRAQETEDAANLEMFERQRQALRERSKIMTAAGEAGVSGSSVLRQLNQSFLDESYDIGIHQSNLENSLSQINANATGVVSNAYSRRNQAASQITTPNPLMRALEIGATGGVSFITEQLEKNRKEGN